MIRVYDLLQITREHPAQWTARLEDGRRMFVHAKWGQLRVWIQTADTSDAELLSGLPIIDVDFGHEHDSCPGWDEVEQLAGILHVTEDTRR